MSAPFKSVFDQVFDVIIFGSGYSGFAAALTLQDAGKHVLLVNRQADILWEGGRAFDSRIGSASSEGWANWLGALTKRNAASDTLIDGALAEIVATNLIRSRAMNVLYYATVVDVEKEDDRLAATIVATKAGLHRLVGRQWIDATESGELIQCTCRNLVPRKAAAFDLHAYFQRTNWPTDVNLKKMQLPDGSAELTFGPTQWDTQRAMHLRVAGNQADPRHSIMPALTLLHEALPDLMQDAVLSHCSLVPLPVYETQPRPATATCPTNIAVATPTYLTQTLDGLAARFTLGETAARQLADLPAHEPSLNLIVRPIAAVEPRDHLSADVVVAGAGTGGAMAAIAAGRAGAQVTCIDPLAFPGGIGSGGGIHWYYYGVSGGLQEELDARIRTATPLFAGRGQCRGFHPEAKKLVLEEMFREAGVFFMPGTTLYAAHRNGQTVAHADAATGRGAVRLKAKNWIDSTGDGDLCAMAGGGFHFGREGDGGLHAYSQSAGRVNLERKPILMEITNYDAGWVDPTNPEDLTRARIVGLDHYLRDRYENQGRFTYMAPAIGLRQGRQIHTDYELQLADLIEQRKFEDCVGFTGAHYDNHAVDYEFESDEGMFWVWGLGQWVTHFNCEIPYRIVLPKGLSNLWIACRAVGVSPDAHHSMRMQRDMQRLGEISGIAAALATKHSADSRSIPFPALRAQLLASGALKAETADAPNHEFGPFTSSDEITEGAVEQRLELGLEAIAAGQQKPEIWHVYRHREPSEARVLTILSQSTNPDATWFAATVLAMWGDVRAEARLLQAIADREDDLTGDVKNRNRRRPRWYVAISLLRRCGTAFCLPALKALGSESDLWFGTRTSIAMTLLRLSERGLNLPPESLAPLLGNLEAVPEYGAILQPQTGFLDKVNPAEITGSGTKSDTREDHLWQLLIVTARLRQAAGLPIPAAALALRHDDRALVRRAIHGVLGD